jgi:uncharacterized protein
MIESLIYFFIMTLSEAVTIFFHPLWGLVGHALVLVAVIVHAARSEDKQIQAMLLSLSIVPLIRIIDLSMPLIPVSTIWRFVIVYAPLGLASFLIVRALGYRRQEIGFKLGSIPLQLLIALSGFFFGWLEYIIIRPQVTLITKLTWSQVVPVGFLLMASTGFVEEFAFRGVLQKTTGGLMGVWGIIYVSGLFAIMHMGFRSWEDVVFVFCVALFFGWMVKKTGSLFGVTLAHGITNVLLFLVMPFLF